MLVGIYFCDFKCGGKNHPPKNPLQTSVNLQYMKRRTFTRLNIFYRSTLFVYLLIRISGLHSEHIGPVGRVLRQDLRLVRQTVEIRWLLISLYAEVDCSIGRATAAV